MWVEISVSLRSPSHFRARRAVALAPHQSVRRYSSHWRPHRHAISLMSASQHQPVRQYSSPWRPQHDAISVTSARASASSPFYSRLFLGVQDETVYVDYTNSVPFINAWIRDHILSVAESSAGTPGQQQRKLCIGVDVERQPTFYGSPQHHHHQSNQTGGVDGSGSSANSASSPPLAVLQLAVQGRVLVAHFAHLVDEWPTSLLDQKELLGGARTADADVSSFSWGGASGGKKDAAAINRLELEKISSSSPSKLSEKLITKGGPSLASKVSELLRLLQCNGITLVGVGVAADVSVLASLFQLKAPTSASISTTTNAIAVPLDSTWQRPQQRGQPGQSSSRSSSISNSISHPNRHKTWSCGVRDLGSVASSLGLSHTTNAGSGGGGSYGLEALALRLLGMRRWKSKRLSVSDWERLPLKRDQVEYAALDAWAGLQIDTVLAEAFGGSFCGIDTTEVGECAHVKGCYSYLTTHDGTMLPQDGFVPLSWAQRLGLHMQHMNSPYSSRSPIGGFFSSGIHYHRDAMTIGQDDSGSSSSSSNSSSGSESGTDDGNHSASPSFFPSTPSINIGATIPSSSPSSSSAAARAATPNTKVGIGGGRSVSSSGGGATLPLPLLVPVLSYRPKPTSASASYSSLQYYSAANSTHTGGQRHSRTRTNSTFSLNSSSPSSIDGSNSSAPMASTTAVASSHARSIFSSSGATVPLWVRESVTDGERNNYWTAFRLHPDVLLAVQSLFLEKKV